MTSLPTGTLEEPHPRVLVSWDETAPVLPPYPGRRVAALLVASDLAIVFASFVAAYWVRDVSLASGAWGRVVTGGALITSASGLVFLMGNLYDPGVAARGWTQLTRMLRAWAVIAGLAILGIFLAEADTPLRSRLALGLFLTAGMAATVLVRVGFWRTLIRSRFAVALRGARVVVGNGPLARRLAAPGREGGFWDPPLVGHVDDGETRKGPAFPVPRLGDLEALRGLAAEQRISEVLVAREDLSRGELVRLAHAWMDDGLHVRLASSAFEVMMAGAPGSVIAGIPVVELRRSPQRGFGLALKRGFDLAAVLLGGALLLPLLGAIAVVVRLTTPGPVLFRQERLGKGGRPFTMLKFRSMVSGNDDARHRRYIRDHMGGIAATTDGEGRHVYKLVNDPRITPVGRFLRRTSLDELPQLWNVLRGDMSLIGPRPCLPYEWELYEDWQRHRLDACPGISGLWQVTGRSRVSFEDMVLLDLSYIANWSFTGDLALLCKTVPVVLGSRGAF